MMNVTLCVWTAPDSMAVRVALNPNSFNAWHYRAWVYKTSGLPEEAVRSWERAIRVSPVDPLLHRSLSGMGTALIELRRFEAQGRRPYVRTPPIPQFIAVSCLLSPFSDVTPKRVRRRGVSLRSILLLQFLRGSLAAGNQTRSF